MRFRSVVVHVRVDALRRAVVVAVNRDDVAMLPGRPDSNGNAGGVVVNCLADREVLDFHVIPSLGGGWAGTGFPALLVLPIICPKIGHIKGGDDSFCL